MEDVLEAPFQEVKKRGPGRPRKVALAPVPEAAPAPVPEPLPVPAPEASLRDVLERLEGMEKRLTPKPRAPRVRAVKPEPAPEPVQSGMGYLNARRANKSMYHSFMPP
jgi:hypothetical protein